MRILGIDLGLKRTGLALSDEMGLSVSILPNLQASSRAMAVDKLMTMVSERSIKIILIGCPEPRSDYSKAIAKRAEGLSFALAEKIMTLGLDVEIKLWDEAYSSKRAAIALVLSGVAQKKRQQKLDGASAAVMVEDFLHSLQAKDRI
jgi:putative Holliday junction resolvase